MDDRSSACEECSTSSGCSEHRLFTCVSCKKLTPWTEASDDEYPDSCSDCWAKARMEGSCPSSECTIRRACSRGVCFGTYPKLPPGKVLDALGRDVTPRVRFFGTGSTALRADDPKTEVDLLARLASSPSRAFCGVLASPDTLAQSLRAWPPNTGCDPEDHAQLPTDPRVVAAAAERVRSVVNGAVLAALVSDGVPEISVEMSYQLAERIAVRAAEELSSALYRAAPAHKNMTLHGQAGQLGPGQRKFSPLS
jgi:hypothetical protein